MNRTFITLFSLICVTFCFAQRFDNTNTISRIARILYSEDNNNKFIKNKNVNVDNVDEIIKIYAYDARNKKLYLYTKKGNFEIKVDKQTHKLYKDDYQLTKFKNKELEHYASCIDKMLEESYNNYNSYQDKYVEDSINCDMIDSLKKVKYLSYSKILQDYEEDKIPLMKKYAENRDWHWTPNPSSLKCLFCNKRITSDFIYCNAIKNDTLYIREFDHLAFKTYYAHIHKAVKPSEIENPLFEVHYKVFQDSLTHYSMNFEDGGVEYINVLLLKDGYDKLHKNVPFGFIEECNWDCEYGNVSLKLTFANTSYKTIKYLDAYFSVYNEVNDIRCKGNLSGTGPIEPGTTGSWDWDYTKYYTAGDSKYLNIDKIVITFMDGTKRVLSNNNCQLEYDKDEIEVTKANINRAPDNCSVDKEWLEDWDKLQKGVDYVNKQLSLFTKETVRKYKSPNRILLSPVFVGGANALNEYVKNNTRYPYPSIAAENNIAGTVKVQFTVKKDGTIENVKVLKGIDPSLDKEAIRVVSTMPKMLPGSEDGEPCNCQMTTGIFFGF